MFRVNNKDTRTTPMASKKCTRSSEEEIISKIFHFNLVLKRLGIKKISFYRKTAFKVKHPFVALTTVYKITFYKHIV